MHALHEHLASILAAQVKEHGTVVWYDPRQEFEPFLGELAKGPAAPDQLLPIRVGDVEAHLLMFGGSYFATKRAAEPRVSGEKGEPLVVYLPGETWDPKYSLLMELEQAGRRWDPSLKRETRRCLQKAGYGEGTIDELLKADTLGYTDLVKMLSEEGGSSQVNLLKTVFDQEDAEALLAAWLADPQKDEAIQTKGAVGELEKLVKHRLGGPFSPESLAKSRAKVLRFVLVNEFLADWHGEVLPDLATEAKELRKEELDRVRKVAARLRRAHRTAYAAQADEVEKALGLADMKLDATCLGRTDTFRFEERALFHLAAEQVIEERYGDAEALAVERLGSFWVNAPRAAQWEVCRRMAVLGQRLKAADSSMDGIKGDPAAWVVWYVEGPDAAAQVDLAFRELETHVATLEDDPEAAKAYGVIRQRYEAFVQACTTGFTQVLRQKGWQVPSVLPQSRVFEERVKPLGAKTAYFLMDAMRFEMGLALAKRMEERVEELRLTPVVASLPTITPVGMGALMPGAAAGFEVVQEGKKVAARVDGVVLPDLTARRKHLKERVPASEDLDLGTVLDESVEKLKARIASANLVVVRSQEIDAAGESGFNTVARRVMDGLLTTDLVKAVQKLQKAGVTNFVLCADHGHQFAKAKADDMKLEAPVGHRVEDHRRCIVGLGLASIPGTVKVVSADLGYRSDLEFLFPAGAGVFKVGGDLAFHHGGPSLQELIVPLLTFRAKSSGESGTEASKVHFTHLPESIDNGIFSVKVECQQGLFQAPVQVHPVLVQGERIVAEAMSAVGGTMDPSTHYLTLEPGKEAGIYFRIEDSLKGTLVIQMLDPHTDQILCKSKQLPLKLLG